MNTKDDVKNFMVAADHTVAEELQGKFTQQSLMYYDLCKEEFFELAQGIRNFDMVETADACADLIWVIEGLCLSLGIPLQQVWDEVARSNMSKCINGKLIKREDGKVLKPDTYSPPDIKSILTK